MKRHIPNVVTLLNLFFGCGALISIFYGQFLTAFWFLFVAGWADYADGLVARLLNVKSPLGRELDSLADMVSFGVVPGAIFYFLLLRGWHPDVLPQHLEPAALPGFMVSVFAGLRLGKFNIDTRQTETFLGLPTPSCTLFTVGLMLIYHFDTLGLGHLVTAPVFLYLCIVALSILMIAEVPMFSLKFTGFRWAGNEIRFIFTGLAIALLLLVREAAFSLIVLLYVLFSLTMYLVRGKT